MSLMYIFPPQQEIFTDEYCKQLALELELVAVYLYAKCHKDFEIIKVKVNSRCSIWETETLHP